MRRLLAITTAATLGLGGAAMAETMATAGTDLNLRSGPGVWHEVIGTLPGGAEVAVTGCIEEANWCEVIHDGTTAWAYGDYLTARMGEEFLPIIPHREELAITVIETPGEIDPQTQGQNAAVGAAAGAVAGALAAGPLGALVGATAGTATGAATTPPAPEIRAYIDANPHEPVFLDGEVVIGAGVPETVTLHELPDAPEYRY
ncbi:MAG: SH3 domain-containing protein, partial [Paracoccus sp. (in: a-proteobacteria)]|nr:SH3 domain-containing protein [Paracoccus sp. (in: a-proteobacteria)]